MTSGPPRERLRHMRDLLPELTKRNDPQARDIKAKLAEIRIRYAWSRRERPAQSFAALRLQDLEAIFGSRWGRHLPDDDAGREDARIAAHHLANLPRGDRTGNVISWLARWAPWMSPRQMGVLATEAIERNIRWKADTLARRIRLTDRERSALCVRTIGAIDLGKADRAKRRRRANKESLRRAKGAVPRAEYEAKSLAQRKPWQAQGISRATWYRRRKADYTGACDTGLSAAYLSKIDDIPPKSANFDLQQTCTSEKSTAKSSDRIKFVDGACFDGMLTKDGSTSQNRMVSGASTAVYWTRASGHGSPHQAALHT